MSGQTPSPPRAPPATETASESEPGARRRAQLRNTAANVGVATLFFLALFPDAARYDSGAANLIWLVGAAMMGVLSLIRVPPSAAMVTPKAIAAVAGMIVTPALMQAGGAKTIGTVAVVAMALELCGVALSQVARLSMARRFGVLPANRGVVSSGPFRLVRHPIYLGWLLLSLGFALSYPRPLNLAAVALTVPFMIWRIALEEELLTADAAYRAYRDRVRYRLIPGLY